MLCFLLYFISLLILTKHLSKRRKKNQAKFSIYVTKFLSQPAVCDRLPGSEFYDVFFLLRHEPVFWVTFEFFLSFLFLLNPFSLFFFFLVSCWLKEEMVGSGFVFVLTLFLFSTECANPCQKGSFFSPSFHPPPILDSVLNNSFGNTL